MLSTRPPMIRPAIQANVRCAFGFEGRGPASRDCEQHSLTTLDYWPPPTYLWERVRTPTRRGFTLKAGSTVLFFNADRATGNATAGLSFGGRAYFASTYEPVCGRAFVHIFGQPVASVRGWHLWTIG